MDATNLRFYEDNNWDPGRRLDPLTSRTTPRQDFERRNRCQSHALTRAAVMPLETVTRDEE